MCGLVAIVESQGRTVTETLLRDLADVIAHRGPDDDGFWTNSNIGLAHKRLSIIDLEHGGQPMTRQGVTIVFNGEIYNYIELREVLKSHGAIFSTTSDTEVLLYAYLIFGDSFIQNLNGMFAFVLFDETNNRLLAARDHFGIKPLYRYVTDRMIIYASEIKAILAHPEVCAELDANAFADYVTLQYTLGEHTLFKGVSKLLPSHYEIVDAQTHSINSFRYWEPDYSPSDGMNEGDAVEELRNLLSNSVRMQMRSDVGVASYLSGGLDSSTVTVLASKYTDQGLKTFSGAFREGAEYDESRYAKLVAESVGAKSDVAYPTEADFIELLPKLVYSMDEPAAGPGLFPQFIVSEMASKHVKVCLGGQGGDEIFGGYTRYPIAYLEYALKQSIEGREPADAPLEDIVRQLPVLKQYVPMLKRFLSQGLFDEFDRRYFHLIDRSEGTLDAFSNDYLHRYDRDAVFERFKMYFDEPQTDSAWNRMTYYDMTTSLPSLLQVEDRVSMAVSLESRVPLLDYRIVEFAARVPPRIKWKGGELKYLFKQAVQPLLPDEVFSRNDKMGFPVPLQIWARGAAKSFFKDVLLTRTCRQRGLFNPQTVEKLINNEASFSRVLWGLLQIELWHLQFIDNQSCNFHGEKNASVI